MLQGSYEELFPVEFGFHAAEDDEVKWLESIGTTVFAKHSKFRVQSLYTFET